jgi:uncharacterized protein (TIGR03905 family)
MSRRTYRTTGSCSQEIHYRLEDGKVRDVVFVNGCNGNTQGISRLVEGMEVDRVISLLKGIDCEVKGTSYPDQLARALESTSDT